MAAIIESRKRLTASLLNCGLLKFDPNNVFICVGPNKYRNLNVAQLMAHQLGPYSWASSWKYSSGVAGNKQNVICKFSLLLLFVDIIINLQTHSDGGSLRSGF